MSDAVLGKTDALLIVGMFRIHIFEIQLEMESVLAAPLFCLLMMCVKLCNLHINCNVLMSVIAHYNAKRACLSIS